jgi:predicted PurR-regulated permease PerM
MVAAVMAGLLSPAVSALSKRAPHGVALAIVLIGTLLIAALVAYKVVDDLNRQLNELQRALPRAARQIEHSERFGEAARDAHLAERVKVFVEELPNRLRGGDTGAALRAAATRGVAFLATGVLTIFFLIYGPKLLLSSAQQLGPERERRARQVASRAYARAWRYVAGSLAMAAMAGLLAYACARALDLPGAAPLALWMALVDALPVIGVVLGALPLVLLAGATSPWEQTALVAVVLFGWQVVEILYLQKRVEKVSLHIGPFVTIAVAMVGLELYGIGGALVLLVLTVLVAATADEIVGLGPEGDIASPP